MEKRKKIMNYIATAFAGFLSIALVICANTASTLMIHQPKTPEGLNRFSKLK